MELGVFDNGIIGHNKKISQVINNEGVYVMHEKGYSYTVGMHNIGSNDLIMFCENRDEPDELFQLIYQAVIHGYVDLNNERALARILSPTPLLTFLTDNEKEQYLYAARTYYGNWSFKALKLIMSYQ